MSHTVCKSSPHARHQGEHKSSRLVDADTLLRGMTHALPAATATALVEASSVLDEEDLLELFERLGRRPTPGELCSTAATAPGRTAR